MNKDKGKKILKNLLKNAEKAKNNDLIKSIKDRIKSLKDNEIVTK